MDVFALVVFSTHTLFELLFGLSAYASGASSSQTAEQRADQPVALSISFRFLGSALLALGVLGAVVIFGPGVRSEAARYAAVAFATFHGLGTLGSVYSSAPDFTVYRQPLTLGAVIVHGALALGFIALLLL